MMVDRKQGRRHKVALAAGPGRGSRPAVAVDDEARRHLVEDCAFFRAARFRTVLPGGYREQDLQAAADAIDAAIEAAINPRRKRESR